MSYLILVKVLNCCGETAEPLSNSKRIVGLGGGFRKLEKFLEVRVCDGDHNDCKMAWICVTADL